jgi:YD repeat-containing protein
MNSLGFRVFCITIAVLFFFESAFSTAFIGDTQSSEFHKNSYRQINKIKDINENEINFAFNSHGHVNWIQDQLLNETEATYDLMGRLLTVTTPLGRTYTVQYDDWGRPERLLFPQVYNEGTEQWETHDVSVEYDHGSLITLLRDELGRETSLLYDDAMRLIQVTNAEEQEIFFDYYDSGALQNFTNGRGKTTTYIYNSRWELFEIYLPDNSQDPYESFQYDEDGNLAGYQNALDQIISYEYDDAGRLTLIDYPSYPLNMPDVSFSYDDADRLVSMVQGSNTTSWEYNAAYELVALSMPQGGLEYEYDNLGRLWKLIKNETAVTEYEYDDASRLVSILNPYNELTEFEYDDDSRLTKKIFANSTYTALSWDDKSRLLSMLHKNSSHSLLKGEAYEYDATNRVTARLRLPENETTTFGYDLIGQLTSETRSGYEAAYTYDANGNRLTRTINNETEEYAYDDGDKLLSITKGQDTIEFFYDACGRLTAIEEPSEAVTELFWDYEDRLTGIEFPDTSVNAFSYNPFGARVSKTDSTGTRTYFRAGVSSRSAVLSDGAATYTPGISERRNNISRFYTLNAQGSTTQLTDSSEDETASFSYDAWGSRIGARNSDDPPFLFGGGFGYETDPDTGLIWNGEKIYLPDIGRFIARHNSSASTGGGYAPPGNNPNTSSSGPIAERVADIAEGGNKTYYVAPEPLDPGDPEHLPPVFAGFTGWAWGKDAQQIKSDLVNAGVTAVVDHPLIYFLPLPLKLGIFKGCKVPKVDGIAKKAIEPFYKPTIHGTGRMVERAITDSMIKVVIRKGVRYYDPKHKTVVFYLKHAYVDGKDIMVAINPYTRRLTTTHPSNAPKPRWIRIDP